MLKLRRAIVVESDTQDTERASRNGEDRGRAGEQRLIVQLSDGGGGTPREVIANVQALDLGLGSGGFDVVHVNLTRGLSGGGLQGANVMKLNYTSLQHA